MLLYQAQSAAQLHHLTLLIQQFIRINKPCITETSSNNDYGHATAAGQSHIIEQFLEKSRSNSKGHYFKADSKTFYFYHESIVYPFAQFTEKKFHRKFSLKIFIEYFDIFTLLTTWEQHPYLLFDFIYTILQFTGSVDIQFYILVIVNISFISAGGSHK